MFWHKPRGSQKEDKTSPQENSDEEHKKLFNKFCSESGQTETMKQQNAVLDAQIEKFNKELANYQDLQNEYKMVKAERKKTYNLNKFLEKQVNFLRNQIKSQIELQEKKSLAEEEARNQTTSNLHLQQEVVELRSELHHQEALEEEYKSLTVKNNTLRQQNDAMSQNVQDMLKKISGQNELEEDLKRKKEENRALNQQHINLQHQIQDLTGKIKDEEKMTDQFTALQTETEVLTVDNHNLGCRIQELKEQYQNVQLNKYQLRIENDASDDDNDALQEKSNDSDTLSQAKGSAVGPNVVRQRKKKLKLCDKHKKVDCANDNTVVEGGIGDNWPDNDEAVPGQRQMCWNIGMSITMILVALLLLLVPFIFLVLE